MDKIIIAGDFNNLHLPYMNKLAVHLKLKKLIQDEEITN
jgi:hypothetical protein